MLAGGRLTLDLEWRVDMAEATLRIDYDDEISDSIFKINTALSFAIPGAAFVDDGARHDGYIVLDLVVKEVERD